MVLFLPVVEFEFIKYELFWNARWKSFERSVEDRARKMYFMCEEHHFYTYYTLKFFEDADSFMWKLGIPLILSPQVNHSKLE